MLTYRAEAGSEKTAKISVHTTQELWENHGRAPEESAAVWIAEAIAETGYDCEVYYDFPLKDAATEASGCNSDGQWESGAYSWWKQYIDNGNVPDDHLAKDGNLLLTNAPGGGCTLNDIGIAGGEHVDTPRLDYQKTLFQPDRYGDWQGRVYAWLHEVGHFFDLGHGRGIIENDYTLGRYYHTPNGPGPGNENPCGQVADTPDPTMDQYLRAYYNPDCSAPHMGETIKEEEDDGGDDPPPGEEPAVTVDVSVSSGTATCSATLHNATIDYWQWQLYDDGTNIGYAEGNPATFDLPEQDDYLVEAIAKTQGGDWVRGEQTFTYDGGGGGGGGPGYPEVEITVANLHKNNGQIDVMADASDPDGSISSYEWTLSTGGSEIDSATGNPSELFADGPGQYTVAVTVTDNDGNTSSASTGVTWETDQGPEVSISVANLHSSSGQIDCLADASDPDGEVVSMGWELIDSGGSVVDSVTGNNVSLQAPERGTYTVRVTAEDDDGNQSSAETEIRWNQPPSVTIDDVHVDDTTGEISCAASGSDPDGFIDSYQWELVGGGQIVDEDAGRNATLQAPQGGSYEIYVIATDNDGTSVEDGTTVTYDPNDGGNGGNQSPNVSIDAINLREEGAVELEATGDDPDGSIQSWEWEILQDGETIDTASGRVASAAVPEHGDYTARVVVTDDLGATASDSVAFEYAPGGGYSRAQLAIATVAAVGLWWAQRGR